MWDTDLSCRIEFFVSRKTNFPKFFIKKEIKFFKKKQLFSSTIASFFNAAKQGRMLEKTGEKEAR